MLSASQRHFALLACLLVAPVLGFATTVDVNGTTIGPGGSTSGNFSFTVDGGLFGVSGAYFSSETGGGPATTLQFNVTAVYDGTTPLASPYSFTVDDMQFYDLTTLPTGTSYDSSAGFAGILPAGTSLVTDVTFGADVLPPLTFVPGGPSSQSSPGETLTGLSSPLEGQFDYTFNFAAGTTQGSSITSTPEPGGVIPVAAILIVGLGVPMIRRFLLLSRT
jgi:hypothetical protein